MIIHLAAALLASAQNPADALDCTDAMGQMAINACAADRFDQADRELNALWREIIDGARENDRSPDNGRMPGDDRTEEATLREAQRAWVSFRDAHCTYEGFSERGGSMEGMIFDDCRTELTRARIAQLRPQPTPDE